MNCIKLIFRITISIIYTYLFTGKAVAGIENLIITEVCSSNSNIILDKNGDYSDWIEIYNPDTIALNLYGLCFSDDINNSIKSRVESVNLIIQPKSYKLFWANGSSDQSDNQINFKISSGEKIFLFNQNYGIIDSITIPAINNDITYGRKYPVKNSEFVYYKTPSPGTVNNLVNYKGFCSPPEFSLPGGFYKNKIELFLSARDNASSVRFTLNGHDPIENHSNTIEKKDTALTLNINTVVRAQAFKEGYFPSQVISNTYFINQLHALPVLSMVTDPDNLYGMNGIFDYPDLEGSEWERFAQHQFFEDSVMLFDVNSGIRIQGGNSVFMDKKSFRLHYKNEYNYDRLDYPLFGENYPESYKHIVLKSGYDDDLKKYNGTLLKDPLSVAIWKELGNLSTGSRWANLYINSDFWGIYNIRESLDEYFLEDHLGTDKFDMIRFLVGEPDLKYGTWNNWNTLDSLIRNTDFTISKNYYKVAKLLDMESFFSHQAFIHCSSYRSWTWGSTCYLDKRDKGKWKWLIWDTDRAYDREYWNGFYEYTEEPDFDDNRRWSNYIPLALISNDIFKRRLINTIADQLNTTFLPTHSIAILDSLANIIRPEVNKEILRWSGNAYWEDNLTNLRTFLTIRPITLKEQITFNFNLNQTYRLSLKISGNGFINLNSLTINDDQWSGDYFSGNPIEIEALPDDGYIFNGWSNGEKGNILETFDSDKNIELTANFIPDTTTVYNVLINEIMYNSSAKHPSGDWIELYNNGNGANLSGWWISDGDSNHRYTFPSHTYLDNGAYLVVAKNLSDFTYEFPKPNNVIGSFGDGETGFGLNGENECVQLFNKNGELENKVCINNTSPWPFQADGLGSSLQLVDMNPENQVASNWNVSSTPYFTPGEKNAFELTDNINITLFNNNVNIYPNPCTSNTLYISSSNKHPITYTIYNLYGAAVKSGKIDSSSHQIDVSGLTNGCYFIKTGYKNESLTDCYKVIIQRK